MRRAAANGVSLLALTDHDGLGGLSRARETANEFGMRFINGVEISIEWGGAQVHLLGYNFDATAPGLNAGLESIHDGRVVRARQMSEALEKIGIGGCLEGAMRFAEDPRLISRAHFARHLAASGVCRDVRSVFESYLVPGKPGYVEHRWPTVAEACDWVIAAGGVVSVAHPARYAFSRAEMRRLLDEFKQCGGQAIEVVSGSHSTDDTHYFGRIAREYGFMASCGSDFHGPDESYADLGRISRLPEDLTPVWAAF